MCMKKLNPCLLKFHFAVHSATMLRKNTSCKIVPIMDDNILFVLPKDSQTGNSRLSTQFPLRCCNRDFRSITGSTGQYESVPELDNNKAPGKIAPLRSFDNDFGHWSNGSTRVFDPTHVSTVSDMVNRITYYVQKNVAMETLWDLDGTICISYSKIMAKTDRYPSQFVYVSSVQQSNPYCPFSAHTVQAYIESERKRGRKDVVFGLPSQSTVVTGIHGSLHNNTSLEMGFDEKEGTKDVVKRTYDPSLMGFVCAGHTAHSSDAGKSRRLCSYTRVRVVHPSILDCIIEADNTEDDKQDWILYCMGITCNISYDQVWTIVHLIRNELALYYEDQFDDPSFEGNMLCPPSFLVYEKEKILYLSISSGVILRSVPGDYMIDSSMMYSQRHSSIVVHPKIPMSGPDVFQYRYSAFFMLCPFVDQDRPPRTLFASGQTTQGIFMPWSVGTARVSPLHTSRPIVATKFVRDIERDADQNPDAMWDVFAGEDLMVCYMNMGLNYEDSMVLSSAFADRGGFATLSLCTYRISESEEIPEEGEKLCGKKYKWWKVDCTDTCICKQKNGARLTSTSGRIPSGRVHQIIRTEDGAISIKVLSFSQILTGDKISTMHGQKGVVRIVPQEDLPILVMEDGSTFNADLYIAVGSIVSRQTNGQIYDSAHGLKGARSGKLLAVGGEIDTSTESCAYVLNPTTGEIIMKMLPSGTIEPVRATVGITRIINQTQMTRERHHLTHRSEGKYSTGTRPGRADGGGVAAAEMDFHAMFASGLYACGQELLDRGNMTIVPICKICHAIEPLHDCGISGHMASVRMPFDSAVFDMISAAANGTCNRYTIEHA